MVKKVEIKEQTQKIIDTIQEGISNRHVNGIPYDLAINEMATAMCKEDYERSGNGCVGCPYAPYRSERCREAVRYIVEYGKYTDLAVVATKVLLGVNK